ncbi:MAG: type II secretion system F family protein [Candidatus Binatia bacterium]
MATYRYRAKSVNGATITGTLEADGRNAAFNQLLSRRLVVLNIEESKQAAERSGMSALLLPFRRQKVRSDSLIFFTYQLAAMLNAGLPIVRSLTVLEEEMAEPYFREVIRAVRTELEGGSSFAAALGKFPKVFGRLYTSLVAAGEQSGNLDEVLKRLAQYMDNMLRLLRKIRSALAYPVVLIVVTVAVVTLLMVKVIPVFEDVYSGANVELPGLTQAVISLSRFLRENLFVIFGALVVMAVAATWFYRTPVGRKLFHRLLFKIPIIGVLVRKNLLARIGRTLGVLVSSGVPMLTALTLARQATGNVLLEEALETAAKEIERGQSLSGGLRTGGGFSAMFVQMVSAGEETGKLPEMLSNVADFYENEVNVMADMLSSLLEPIFIVGVGSTIGVIVIAMYLPIFKLGQVLQ